MGTDNRGIGDSYAEQLLAGQQKIQRRWEHLAKETRALLAASGFYSERGRRVDDTQQLTGRGEHDIERLEHALGKLVQCCAAKLPYSKDSDTLIPGEVLDRDIPAHCEELIFHAEWRDPEFVSLGLKAIIAHETAKALLLSLPAKKMSIPASLLFGITAVALILLLPAAIGAALVSAAKGDLGATVLALYGAAICAWPAWWSKQKETGKDVPVQDRHYRAWRQLHTSNAASVIGSGAQHGLANLLRQDIPVPPVAFDLCAALHSAASKAP